MGFSESKGTCWVPFGKQKEDGPHCEIVFAKGLGRGHILLDQTSLGVTAQSTLLRWQGTGIKGWALRADEIRGIRKRMLMKERQTEGPVYMKM